MSLEDMPQPGTAAWDAWFKRQSPDIQQTVVWSFGYNDANTLPGDATAGGMAPQLDPNSYDLSSMYDAPVDYNSKGAVLPFGLDQASQTTNVIQDRNSLLPDNVIAALSGPGAYDTDAFNPTYEPQGTPIQATGNRTLQAMANDADGGWQSFIAQKILSGATPSSAMAQLKAIVMAPPNETATPQAQAARTTLINSLPARYGTPDPVTGDMPKVDYSTPQGFANAFDEKSISEGANSLFEKVMSDPQVGYTDPETGLEYAGAKKVDSPTSEWFRKYGLPTPVESYTDPDMIEKAQQSAAPFSQDDMTSWLQGIDDTTAQNDSVFNQFKAAQDQYKQQALQVSGPAGATRVGGKLNFGFDTPGAQAPKPSSPFGDISQWLQSPQGMGAFQSLNGGGGQLPVAATAKPGQVGAKGTVTPDMLQGQFIKSMEQQAQESNPNRWAEGNLQTGRKAGLVDRSKMVDEAAMKMKTAQSQLQPALDAKRRAGTTPDAVMQQVLAAMALKRLADNGRTPLQDALQQRMLTVRNQGVLGY